MRELAKCLERALALAGDGTIELAHLPEEVREPAGLRLRREPTPAPLGAADQARRDQLVALLQVHAGNVAAVSRAMGTVRSQVQRWMKPASTRAE